MLIDETYFTGDLHIDGLVSSEGVPSLTNEAINSEFKALAAKYERDFYRQVLGKDNADAFVSFLDLLEKDPDKADERRWLDLMEVLVDDAGGTLESPIAYYIYFFYLRRNQLEATPVGATEADAKIVPCNRKMIDAWNQMVYMNDYLSRWLFDHRDDYGGYFFDNDMLETINQFGI